MLNDTERETRLLMGNEIFAHAALEAGVNVVAGYPGTPSSELIETVARLRAQGCAEGVHVEWSTNEKAALELLSGAAYCGARVLFTCKQMGLNVAADALLSLNYVGVKGGTVLFVADDPGPISSQTEQDTRRFAAFAKVPVFDPTTPDEGFAMMKAAFELSERYGTPVIVRPTTRICHASTFISVAKHTVARPLPPEGFERSSRWIIFPKRSFEAHGEVNARLAEMAEVFSKEPAYTCFNKAIEGGGESACGAGDTHGASVEAPTLGIVAGGVSASYAKEALCLIEETAAREGMNVPPYRFMAVGTPYPFPASAAGEFLAGLHDVLVFEELDSVLEEELMKVAGAKKLPVTIRGKLSGEARDRGENTTTDIALRLAAFFDGESGETCDVTRDAIHGTLTALLQQTVGADALIPAAENVPIRPPVLCAGCPHRGSFYAVKQAIGLLRKKARKDNPNAPALEAVFCGDIGCYTLGNAAPLEAIDTCLCMGAGITQAQGFSLAEPRKKAIAFVGDSTFFASGMTGVANAVYNNHDITIVVLDNSTTAMTGTQPHPGTGVPMMGTRSEPIEIDEVLEALGVTCIMRANPYELDEAVEAAEIAIAFEGPSALIYKAPCIQISKPAPPAEIDADCCTGCRRCITEIGCPAIGFRPDAKGPKSADRGLAFIDDTLCTGCDLCVQVCPFKAIVSHEQLAGNGSSGTSSSEGGANR